MIDLIGWLASALFVGSYLLPATYLRRMQILGALTWTAYGVFLRSPPLIVANIVFVMAALSSVWRSRRQAVRSPVGTPPASPV